LVTPGAKIWGRRRQCESGDLRLMSNDWRDLVFYPKQKCDSSSQNLPKLPA
jgi:hypothetical protein